jgi:DhnA family fructose-bisphosphate aldolase class Ia
MGAVAVGATIYFGSDQAARQIVEVSQAFAQAHDWAGHHPVVLPAQQRLQDRRKRTTTSPPTSPARPTTWA